MIPLRDNIPSRTTPFVNYSIIVICSGIFLLQLQDGPNEPSLVEKLGMIPARVMNPDATVEIRDQEVVKTPRGAVLQERTRPAAPSLVPPWLTLLTCTFLHGGWLHIIGNMWFLYIFGDNVEDRFGHLGYLVFYLGSGVAASAVHLASGPGSTVPTIGASGAIAGIMGAYLLLYPHAKVLTLVPIFFFLYMTTLPAPLFLGVWFAIQFFQGTLAVTATEAGGVAWWAHIGGFAVGAGGVLLMKSVGLLKPPVSSVRSGSAYSGFHRMRQNDWRH